MKLEKPSDLEMQILGLLWRDGPLTAREVLNRAPDGKKRAYTSILSVMQVMEKKGLLARSREGLTDRWRPNVDESQILTPFMKNLVAHVFGGKTTSVMQCLLDGSELDQSQIGEIRELLDTYEKGGKPAAKRKA
jgi:BlaI family transcriptional regulator, penicillinase repressor